MIGLMNGPTFGRWNCRLPTRYALAGVRRHLRTRTWTSSVNVPGSSLSHHWMPPPM